MTIDQQRKGFIARHWPPIASTRARDNLVLQATPSTHVTDFRSFDYLRRPAQYPIEHARTLIRYSCLLPNHR